MKNSHLLIAGLCLLLGNNLSLPAMAAPCFPGLPCESGLTPNDPAKPDDGPNAAGAPNAKKSDSGACDADFMNQIYANAFLESERETVINATLVHKPDSVMEYTCLDQQAAWAAKYAGPLFSESTAWHTDTVPINGTLGYFPPADGGIEERKESKIDVYMGDDRLDTSLENLVLAGLKTYVDKNFANDFLGGTAVGDNNTISATVSGAQNVCDFMYAMYHLAKCNDFGLDAPFMTFEKLVGNDPRQRPPACTGGHKITTAMLDLAGNKDFKFAAFDKLDPELKITSADNGCENETPIPTGVKVDDSEYGQDLFGNRTTISSGSHEDKVCSNPACHYDKEANKCVP